MPEKILEKSALHLLHRTNQSVSDIFIEQMQGENLTPRQYAVLAAVAENQGLNQTSLVKLTGIDRSTLADIVQRMLKKELLTRKRTEKDGRAYSVYLSELGKKCLDETTPNVEMVDNKILELLPEDERTIFLKSLQKIIEGSEKLKEVKGQTPKPSGVSPSLVNNVQ